MKKLTKIKLINWHLFSNETIYIKDNALISGENGSGKTTLLDALQYLLVGGKSGAKFNIAATDDARRTLDGYVRGNIGAENKKFLREGDVITHVALEFFDERNKISSIVGCILDLPRTGVLKERFYILEDCCVDDKMFLEGRKPRDFKSMKAYLKEIGHPIEPFETQKKYREGLSRFFGMNASKYGRILPKALAFRSLDLQGFFFDFLLDDDPIDVSSLKHNVEQLKKIETQIRSDKERLEKLDNISSVGVSLTNSKEQLLVNDLIERVNFIEKRDYFLKKSLDEIKVLDQKIETLRDNRNIVNQKLEDNADRILELEKAKSESDLSRTISKYQSDLDKKERELAEQKDTVAQVIRVLKNEVELAKKITSLSANKGLDSFIKYFEVNEDRLSQVELAIHLNNVSAEFKGFNRNYSITKNRLDEQIRETSENIRACQSRLSQLKRNKMTYPRSVEALIEVLNKELSELYGTSIQVQPLCDLIDVNDESWRNALEGYLGARRFNLIIDPKYFDDATKIYENSRKKLNIFNVGLVDAAKLKEHDDLREDSLARKIDSDDIYARRYIDAIIGNVVCVTHALELKKHYTAVSINCMTYGGNVLNNIDPRIYETPYIGARATELQINIEVADLNSLEAKLDGLYDENRKNDVINTYLQETRTDQILNQNRLLYLDLVGETKKEVLKLEEHLESLGHDPNLDKINEQINKLKEIKNTLSVEYDEIVGKVATAREQKQRISDAIEESRTRLDEYLKEENEMARKHPGMLEVAKYQYEIIKNKQKNDFDAISNYIRTSNDTLRTLASRQENDLINQMKRFIEAHNFSAEPSFDVLFLYDAEANLIRNNNLIRYEREALELRNSSEISFKEEFVNKLRASIENALQQVSELNLALNDKTFGSDAYQLVCNPSLDNDFKLYYNIIMGTDSLKHTLLTQALSDENQAILMELFEKIASPDPENDRLAYQFLDYRNYMSYDIEITNRNGNKSFFSKVSKEKSGGETQVPFYIVIAASFQQLLTKNKRVDSGCVVLFDEAFNNMDESRIDAMMKFYNSLSIQLFIAVPPQRVSNIISYVNTSLVVVKDNDYAIVEAFQDERMKKI